MSQGTIIRAKDLRPGDDFETMLTGAAGICRDGSLRAGGAVPVEIWYPDRSERLTSLHPHVKVRLLVRARGVA